MKKKLVVLSVDAMVWEDVEYLRQKPNFQRLLRNCSGVERAETVYPSITYPAHVSIMTGCRAGKHGVFTNGALSSQRGPLAWHYDGSVVQVEDIFAAAKRAGCSTAAVYWPVTGNNPNIDYLINEYFFLDDPSEDPHVGYGKYGASKEMLEVVDNNMGRWPYEYHIRGKLQLDMLKKYHTFDDFIIGCDCDIIRRFNPDVLLTHICMIDTLRHRYGLFNDKVLQGLDMVDEWLGELADAIEAVGELEDTNFVLLSDHGQMDFARRLKVNVLLRRGGFIDVDEKGDVTDWRAFSQSNGMSSTVWVRGGEAVERQVYDYLQRLMEEGVWGFSKIHTRAEAAERFGMDGDFAFVVETDGYTAFGDSWDEPVVNNVDITDYRLGAATHGYEPQKGPQPVFLAKGPDFKENVMLPYGKVIDEAPTLAAVLGESMPQAEGKCMQEILR